MTPVSRKPPNSATMAAATTKPLALDRVGTLNVGDRVAITAS
jgi:hypothetical protein